MCRYGVLKKAFNKSDSPRGCLMVLNVQDYGVFQDLHNFYSKAHKIFLQYKATYYVKIYLMALMRCSNHPTTQLTNNR